uniref:Uncharacterized protein MANES_09G076300 n=1 Tax=Rhizophora mucronata TaxID=61149 RepID=A0A2P2MK35_RHIMU
MHKWYKRFLVQYTKATAEKEDSVYSFCSSFKGSTKFEQQHSPHLK